MTASPYGAPIAAVDELAELDDADVLEGYSDGLAGEPEPLGNRSRSYWHGWRNGRTDRGDLEPDAAQRELARQAVAAWRIPKAR